MNSLEGSEQRRLNALHRYEVLDSLPEVEFDRLTRIVAHLLDVPLVLINFIDTDRGWFKSSYGTPLRQVPRAMTICAFTVLEDHILVIPDLQHLSEAEQHRYPKMADGGRPVLHRRPSDHPRRLPDWHVVRA
ncbi:hypothetical protein ACFFLM_00220 [Deinococcus oregonensis]|uniref:GAF domain-containing protein n=1 Tax=Deinococcus oregonensis TaxID=1805970 RepID=A0ABV6ASD6_9DEIO